MAWSFPVAVLTGPRQSGKTTLVRKLFSDKPYVSMEDPDIHALALDDPRRLLERYTVDAVVDEAQHAPESNYCLQIRDDETSVPALFVLTESRNFLRIRDNSPGLAGWAATAQLMLMMLAELARGPKRFAKFSGQDSHNPALIFGDGGGMSWHGVRALRVTVAGMLAVRIMPPPSFPVLTRRLSGESETCGEFAS